MINKKFIFIGAYVLLLIIESFFYVPYEEIEIFRSDQNVPHTEIIGNGYVPLDEIRKDKAWLANNDITTTGKRVDSWQLVTNLFTTTIVALLLYFIFIYLEDRSKIHETEFELLQRKVDVLNYDNQILQDYKTVFLQFKNALAQTANDTSMTDIKEPPTIDINDLAFADEETQDRIFKQYADNISAYTAYKIYATLKNEASK